MNCASCTNTLRDGAAFCDACGAPVESAPVGAAERRQLTVMFCDLVGSTQLSQRLDPEDLSDVVTRYHRAASCTVEGHGGHVAQYLGDGLLAYFGYPRAHGDDAERAVRAGLEILGELESANDGIERDHGVRLEARIGIHTGVVVMGEVGGGARRERLALGDTTNIAARLEGVAETNSVWISDATLRLVEGLFVTVDQGHPTLKGVASPIRAYTVLQPSGARARIEGPVHTPLAGRDAELAALEHSWRRVCEGSGQVMVIAGEGGIGKSRLLQALRRSVGGVAHTWLEARCTSFTAACALQPIVELMERGLRFEASDGDATRLAKLEAGLEVAEVEPGEVIPVLASLLGFEAGDDYAPLPTAPERIRQRTLEALTAWVAGLSRRQPVVVACEDLQWSDPTTLELLRRLRAQCGGHRVLVVLTHRPLFEASWVAATNETRLTLGRLDSDSVREIVLATIEGALPAEAIERIIERADGVPLFAEELGRMMAESGVGSDAEIPMTLQDLLMARVDRLGPARDVAQRAAVIGREFPHALLAAISPESRDELEARLEELVRVELLHRRGIPPHASYVFKHALVLDVAYGSLLRRTQQQLHARIAQALEEHFATRIELDPALLAHHLDRGGESERATGVYVRASRRAGEASANAEAESLLQRAAELVSELPEGRTRDELDLTVHNLLGIVSMRMRGYADEAALPAFERAERLATTIGADEARVVACVGLSAYYQNRADHDRAIGLAEQIVDLAGRTGSPLHRLTGHGLLAPPALYTGDLARSLAESRSALRHYPRSGVSVFTSINDFGVAAHGFAAWSATLLGFPDEGLESAAAGVELAEKLEHAFSIAMAYVFRAATHLIRREPVAARAWALRAIELADELDFPLWYGLGIAVRGWGDLDAPSADGLSDVQEGLAIAGATGSQAGAPLLLSLLGEANLREGDLASARSVLEGALALAVATNQPFVNEHLELLLGDVEAALDEHAAAEAHYRRALDQSRRTGARLFELRAATRLVNLPPGQGGADARADLADVYAWFHEGFDTPDLVDARVLLGLAS